MKNIIKKLNLIFINILLILTYFIIISLGKLIYEIFGARKEKGWSWIEHRYPNDKSYYLSPY